MFLLERARTAGDSGFLFLVGGALKVPSFLCKKKRPPRGAFVVIAEGSELEGGFDQSTKAV